MYDEENLLSRLQANVKCGQHASWRPSEVCNDIEHASFDSYHHALAEAFGNRPIQCHETLDRSLLPELGASGRNKKCVTVKHPFNIVQFLRHSLSLKIVH